MSGFMVLVTGAACALCFYHLAVGVFRLAPEFNRGTLEMLGIPSALVVYTLAGPIILVTSWSEVRERMNGSGRLLLPLAIVWAASLGIVAVEGGRALLSSIAMA